MPTTIATYRCLLISPSDVSTERDIIEHVITQWNAHVGGGLDARIEAIRWESHARPEMGGHPQEIINRQLVDDCDFGIAVFWSRLGSPTKEHESGSAEEIARLLAKGSRVMVYFCTRPVPQDAALGPQFPKLQDLKERYQQQGLLGSYSDPAELRSTVNLHITSLMTELLLKSRASGQPIPSTGTLTAPMPDIRVTTRAAFIVHTVTKAMLCVTIENHSPVKFYAGNVTLECKDGTHILVQRDSATGRPNGSRELDPGDSFDFFIDGDDDGFREAIEKNPVVCAVVKDKIGRIFRSDPQHMPAALSALKPEPER